MKDQTEVFLFDLTEVFLIAFCNQENLWWGGMGCSCLYNHVTLI